jgi:hypothetical protein
MSLRRAHDALTRLAKRQAVAVEFDADDAGQLYAQLSDVGVNASKYSELTEQAFERPEA